MLSLLLAMSAGAASWDVPGDFSTIAQALNNVGSGDTINLTQNAYNESALNVWINVEIRGNGTTTIGTNLNQAVFVVQSGTLTLRDLTIDPQGSNRGMRLLAGTNATLDNVVFQNGASLNNGGCLQAVDTNVISATGGAFINCTTWRDDGTAQGGALFMNVNGRATFDGTAFTGNTATSPADPADNDRGGAILAANGSVIRLSNLKLTNNQTDRLGGAIFATDADIYATDVLFENNTAGEDGGGIYAQAGSLVEHVGGGYSGNTATIDDGSAIRAQASDIWLTDVQIELGTHGSAGAVYLRGASTLTTTRGAFVSNVGLGSGPAIYAADTAVVTIDGTAFTTNSTSGNEGGAVRGVESSLLNIFGANFTSNTAPNTGALRYETGTLTLGRNVFTSNTTPGEGGALKITGGATATDDGSVFVGNSATSLTLGAGGALLVDNASYTGTDITVEGNTSNTGGGGIAVRNGGTIDLTRSNLLTNTAPSGGGALISNGNLDLTGGQIVGNTVAGNGGGVALLGGTLLTTNVLVEGNQAGVYGGGGTLNSGTATIIGGAWVQNISDGDAGGLFVDTGTTVTTYDTTWQANAANAIDAYGASILANDNYDLTIERNRFLDHPDADLGVVTCVSASPTACRIWDSWFETNDAARGGGVYIDGDPDAQVLGNVFCHTQALYGAANAWEDGGGLFITGGAADVRGNVFFETSAIDEGGAFDIRTNALTLANNTVVGVDAARGAHGMRATFTSSNQLYAHNPQQAVNVVVGWLTYHHSAFWMNGVDVVGNGTDGGDNVYADPLLQGGYQPGNCDPQMLVPLPGSPLIDAGDPDFADPDGTVSDIGAFGGQHPNPYADVDGDGVPGLDDCNDFDPGIIGNTALYPDADGDGYGSMFSPSLLFGCKVPGYVTNTLDCNDGDPAIHPNAPEVCDGGVDNDCDGLADDLDPEGANGSSWYDDLDGDGHGDENDLTPTIGCVAPPMSANNNGDCNDTDGAIHPGATEVCDAANVDEDCDTLADDADSSVDVATYTPWYADADGDGFGDGSGLGRLACDAVGNEVANNGDCNDADGAIHPNATEVCDPGDVDEDCDTGADDADPDGNATGKTLWYTDGDGDGHGVLNDPGVLACDNPGGAATVADDCNDADGNIHPGANEVCDPLDVDEDCDTLADDADPDVTGQSDWYPDVDGDNWGTDDPNAVPIQACDAPPNTADNDFDCDDTNGAINPAATEVCDAADTDENCVDGADDADPQVDPATKTDWWPDTDTDGFGRGVPVQRCDAPADHAGNGLDCDDTDAAINPDAAEVCDASNVDEDCDTFADDADPEGASGKVSWYLDADGDFYGDENDTSPVVACDAAGRADNALDCDDSDVFISPAAFEICDAADTDEDCDGFADDLDPGGATGQVDWYLDGDGDGFGDENDLPLTSCDDPGGRVDNGQDCLDSNAAVNPDGTEVCDGADLDEDCDGGADDLDPQGDAQNQTPWYHDADADGFGDPTDRQDACDAPPDYIADDQDCGDDDANVNPNGTEACDAADVDEDCDGFADDADPQGNATGRVPFYADADGDGFGDPLNVLTRCDAPGGYIVTGGDCNDADLAIHPDATEVCDPNNTDEDCDGFVNDADPSATGQSTWYDDVDGDGFGDVAAASSACVAPPGTVSDATDCDDTRANVSPTGTEACDPDDLDEDCDGLADDADPQGDATGQQNWHPDTDNDGYGDDTPGNRVTQCEAPAGHLLDNRDCDDGDATLNPDTVWYEDQDQDGIGNALSSVTACDAPPGSWVRVSGDCNDSDATIGAGATWYADADGDSYGDANTDTVACIQPIDFVSDDTDCDDTDPDVNPDTVWYEDQDQDGFGGSATVQQCADPGGYTIVPGDCDDNDASVGSSRTFYNDADSDGYGDQGGTPITSCQQPSGTADNDLDCDDTNNTVYTGADEVCDGRDNDCDGDVDEAPPSWFRDLDADTYGDASTFIASCVQPAGYVPDDQDCDDTDPTLNPTTPWYADTDGDGLGDANTVVAQCVAPAAHVRDDQDCDDTNAAIGGPTDWWPDADADGAGDDQAAAVSACLAPTDHVDNDSDCDDTDAAVHPNSNWYADFDGDGYGDLSAVTTQCDNPGNASLVPGDCDDLDPAIHPAATEICDGDVDNDCQNGADDADPNTDQATKTSWYADADGDGYGGTLFGVRCNAPPNTVDNNDDCDDGAFTTSPTAPEQCDGIDNNCNGLVDDNIATVTWYADADGDGYGDASAGSQVDCRQPAGHAAFDGDCNESDPSVHPGATEVCDSVDNDCSGQIDGADATDATNWWTDADRDGFGDPSAQLRACTQPTDAVANSLDCNDAVATTNPSALEFCNNVDDNCNTAVDEGAEDAPVWYLDSDGDGAGDPSMAVRDCDQPSNHVDNTNDCDDADNQTWVGAPEQCDDIDNDCNGTADDGLTELTWYADFDQDGYGDPLTVVLDCAMPAGYVADDTDCDDTTDLVHPAQTEQWYDGVDQDCDGRDDDQDLDGFGVADDCDDTDPDVNPDAEELPGDDIDQDCDGEDIGELPETSVRTPSDTDTDTDTDLVDKLTSGCGCETSRAPLGGWLVLALVAGRRRRSA